MNATRYATLFICLTTTALVAVARGELPSKLIQPDTGDIVLAPNKGALTELEKKIRVTFSTPMVDLEKLHRGGQPSPILFEPTVEVRWVWMSQTEGRLTLPIEFVVDNIPEHLTPAAEIFRVRHVAKLRPGLRDLAGNLVDSKNWGIAFAGDEFAVTNVEFLDASSSSANAESTDNPNSSDSDDNKSKEKNEEEGQNAIKARDPADPLSARPRCRLEFSRDVLPQDVTKMVYFQDRATNERFPVEVNLEERQKLSAQGWVLIEPSQPLPSGRSFELVIDRLRAPNSGEDLPHLLAISAGTTYEPKIEAVIGYNEPTKGPFIRVVANQSINTGQENPGLVVIEPAVNDLKMISTGVGIEIHGKFDTSVEYKVTLKAGLQTRDGFFLKNDSFWRIAFRPKRPAILLPQETVFQRASLPEVRVSLVEVNTGVLEWKIARIPRDQIALIRTRLREFAIYSRDENDNPKYDPVSGENLYNPTEPLISALQLPVVASGELESSWNDLETPRQIVWEPGNSEAGLFLVEILGKDSKGRQVGNRSIISRGDWLVAEKDLPGGASLRVIRMTDAVPVSKIPVEIVDSSGKFSGPQDTDEHGEALFENGGDIVLIGQPGHESMQILDSPEFRSGLSVSGHEEVSDTACVIVTDRNVYRPGETVKFKAFVRKMESGKPTIDAGETIKWEITDEGDESLYEESSTISTSGSFVGEWQTPLTAYGEYFIKIKDVDDTSGSGTKVTVTEFRPPPFSVLADSRDTVGDSVAVKVTSALFNGAPNAAAKVHWKAEWIIDDWRHDDSRNMKEDKEVNLVLNDDFAPDSPSRGFSEDVVLELRKAGWNTAREDRELSIAATAEGETGLNSEGTATITCKSPFSNDSHYNRARVYWIIDVTSASTAQTVRGGTRCRIQFAPQILGVSLENAGPKQLHLKIGSFDMADLPAAGLNVKAEIFRRSIKTVKERLGPDINRYRNTPIFEKVWEDGLVTPGEETITVSEGGNYVVRVTAPESHNVPQVSDTAALDEEEAEVTVDNENSLKVACDRDHYEIGETAFITVQSPCTGLAMVTVETDDILYRKQVELKGNVQRIPLPVLPSFAPNAYVAVHLLRPAPDGGVPAEKFGFCELKVGLSGERLQVVAGLEKDVVEPRAKVRGKVKISALGKPVASADVLVFAVDESVLALGRWEIPNFIQTFYPERTWRIKTHAAENPLWATDNPQNPTHSQKGFILGDTGVVGLSNISFRKDFKPLAFWSANLRSNAEGEVFFDFAAPDGLTSYRIVAVAQKGPGKFGNGHCILRLSKQLQVEPVLPSFLRNGDKISLTTIVRQNYADSAKIDVAVTVDSGIEFTEPRTKRIIASRGEPVAVEFGAIVTPEATRAKIGFAAALVGQLELKDGEENTVSIHPAEVERRTTIAGTVSAVQPFDIVALTPNEWLRTKGRCDVLLSGSPFLPKLAGLPAMLDAEGCTEKLASRVLAATLLTSTVDALPLGAEKEKSIRDKARDSIKRLTQSIVDNEYGEGIPTWPGTNKLDGQRSQFCTIEAAWAILKARDHDYIKDDRLIDTAEGWLSSIVQEREHFDDFSPSMRCFALMAYGNSLGSAGSQTLTSEAEELFNDREELKLNVDARAWLALGMFYLGVLPEDRETLLREIDQPLSEIAFDPAAFSSKTRTAALRFLAQIEIESANWSEAKRQQAIHVFDEITQSSVDLSTQENLWLLLALDSLVRADVPAAMGKLSLLPKPTTISKDSISVGWLGVPLDKLSEIFKKPLKPGVPGSYVIQATSAEPISEMTRGIGGLRIDRIARDVTDSSRTGTKEAPWKAGDLVLVSYRLSSERAHNYLELEDQLPACLETINSKLPPVAENFPIPVEGGVNTLVLSHVELRFARTLLYFESTPPGQSTYSVLCRVIVPGTFHWPATQVQPMYDSRFIGISHSVIVHVK